MSENVLYRVSIPSDLEYIPALRQLMADVAKLEGFSEKMCFRTEIMVDELTNNAIMHGAQDINCSVQIEAVVTRDELELKVLDQGGPQKNLDNLRKALSNAETDKPYDPKRGRGLEIVQMLSDRLQINVEKQGFTEVRIVKNRSTEPGSVGPENLLYSNES